MKDNLPVILISNDDGVNAKGIKHLTEVVKDLGDIYVFAPSTGQSGQSHAITVKNPIRIKKQLDKKNLKIYSCSGTPVDAIKIALNKFLPRRPDLILSGINHGANSAASVIYSGTMAVAMEGCVNQIPAIGFSLCDHSPEADFSATTPYIRDLVKNVLTNGLPKDTCINVNFPAVPASEIQGLKVCRQNRGYWQEEFDERTDPSNKKYYWLTGEYNNCEPDAEDTDEWAIEHNFISIVPVQSDLTAHKRIESIKKQLL